MIVLTFFILFFSVLSASQLESDEEGLSLCERGKLYFKNDLIADASTAAVIVLAPRLFPKATKVCAAIATLGFFYCIFAHNDPVAGKMLNSLVNPKLKKQGQPKVLTLLALGYNVSDVFRRGL